MACCICNRAGHDEELHGEEGEEILKLRAVARAANDAIDALNGVQIREHRRKAVRKLEDALVEAGERVRSMVSNTEETKP